MLVRATDISACYIYTFVAGMSDHAGTTSNLSYWKWKVLNNLDFTSVQSDAAISYNMPQAFQL